MALGLSSDILLQKRLLDHLTSVVSLKASYGSPGNGYELYAPGNIVDLLIFHSFSCRKGFFDLYPTSYINTRGQDLTSHSAGGTLEASLSL